MSDKRDKTIEYIESFLDTDYVSLERNLKKMLKDYDKKSRRLDKIIKVSDKQQLSLMSLNKQISDQKDELTKLYNYDTQQQKIAKEKLDLAISNDLDGHDDFKSQIIYQPSDILSGDFYSLHVLKNGALFAYVIDGQGHGISPALTVFGVSSTIAHLVEDNNSFQEIIDRLFPMIQKFLGDIEQLTYTMMYIDKNKKSIEYISGGMYPLMIKKNDEILTYKANNLPFMNFSPIPVVSSIDIQDWNEIIIYTDGLVEDLDEDMSEFSPQNILNNPQLFEEVKETLSHKKFEDDITVLKIINS